MIDIKKGSTLLDSAIAMIVFSLIVSLSLLQMSSSSPPLDHHPPSSSSHDLSSMTIDDHLRSMPSPPPPHGSSQPPSSSIPPSLHWTPTTYAHQVRILLYLGSLLSHAKKKEKNNEKRIVHSFIQVMCANVIRSLNNASCSQFREHTCELRI